MDVWDVIKWGSIGIGGAVATGVAFRSLYRAGVRLYDDVHERWRQHQHDRLTLENIRDQNELHNIRAIPADERGRYPLLYGKGGILRDPNNLRAFTLRTVLDRWPQLERLDWMLRRLIAMQGVPSPAARQLAAPIEQVEPELVWPEFVTMEQALRGQRPTITDLVVGVYPTEDGIAKVSASLHELMHVLEVGASGWGKSTWLRSFLYQVARAPEPCEVVAIDPSGSAFNALKGWGRLRYPVARQTEDAVAVLEQVSEEIARRRTMYEAHPYVEKLDEYNRATGADIPPWVVVVDEGTHLLHQGSVTSNALREVVQTARQYGIYCLMAGQTAKANVIRTEIRDQFSTRLGFRTSRRSLGVVFDDSVERPSVKGQAWVQMVGSEDPLLIQGLWVDKSEFLRVLSNGGPKYQMPVVEGRASTRTTPEQRERIIELHEEGQSQRAIEREVFGFEGGSAYRAVREVLGTATATSATEDDEAEGNESDQEDSDSSSIDWCDFCGRSVEMAKGVKFIECSGCGVAVCVDCAVNGLCPDCNGRSTSEG